VITIPMAHTPYHIGVISDTHGLFRPEAAALLQGVHLILHAGDVGSPQIAAAMEKIAPLVAVHGNMDHGLVLEMLPESETIQLGSVRIHLLHDVAQLQPDVSEFDLIVSGHTHRPHMSQNGRTTYLNPGSAGPQRFGLPASMAKVEVLENSFSVQHYNLTAAPRVR
jgi:hypothetical protein